MIFVFRECHGGEERDPVYEGGKAQGGSCASDVGSGLEAIFGSMWNNWIYAASFSSPLQGV